MNKRDISGYAEGFDGALSVIGHCVELLKQANKEKTLDHVTKVGRTGIEIAEKYGLDKSKVETACYLHDIGAIVPKDDYY